MAKVGNLLNAMQCTMRFKAIMPAIFVVKWNHLEAAIRITVFHLLAKHAACLTPARNAQFGTTIHILINFIRNLIKINRSGVRCQSDLIINYVIKIIYHLGAKIILTVLLHAQISRLDESPSRVDTKKCNFKVEDLSNRIFCSLINISFYHLFSNTFGCQRTIS